MITQADVREVEGGVELQQDGAKIYLRIQSGAPYEVKIVSLYPPPLPYDKEIEGLKRLEIHWKREAFPGDKAILNVELESIPY